MHFTFIVNKTGLFSQPVSFDLIELFFFVSPWCSSASGVRVVTQVHKIPASSARSMDRCSFPIMKSSMLQNQWFKFQTKLSLTIIWFILTAHRWHIQQRESFAWWFCSTLKKITGLNNQLDSREILGNLLRSGTLQPGYSSFICRLAPIWLIIFTLWRISCPFL